MGLKNGVMPPIEGLRAVVVGTKRANLRILHTLGATAPLRTGSLWGSGVGALPGRVVYLVPAVITLESTVGEIAAGEAVGAVSVRSVTEWVHTWTVAGSRSPSRGPWGTVGKCSNRFS